MLLSVIYNNDPVLGEEFNTVVRKVMDSYNCKNYYLARTKEYNPVGRFQTEAESDIIADEILDLLNKEKIEDMIHVFHHGESLLHASADTNSENTLYK